MKPKTMRKISLFLLYSGLFGIFSPIIFIYQINTISSTIIYIYLGICVSIIIASIILSIIFWRCPHCGRMFELRHSAMDKIKYCPYCGKEISL